MNRRTAIKQLGVAGTVLSTFTGITTANQSKNVPKGLAKKAAAQKKQQLAQTDKFSKWAGATLARPQTFFTKVQHSPAPKYKKTAYVFPINKENNNLGYITTAALKDWAPILEYTQGTPPHYTIGRAQEKAKRLGKAHTGRLLYRGGISYDYELEDRTAVRLKGQYVINLPETASRSTLNFDSTTTQKQWQTISSDSSLGTTSYPDSVFIDSVPGYCTDYEGGSDVKGSNQYPDYVGNPDDYYHDYDGCAPYAGANVLGDYEGIGLWDWSDRNTLIDNLHYHMDTGDDIYTDLDKIAPGIEEYDDGQYTYTARTETFSETGLKDEIYNLRPAILTMWDGGSPEEDGYQTYDNHTVAVAGYEERSDGLYWGIYDSYEYVEHWIANNNWNDADNTYVNKN